MSDLRLPAVGDTVEVVKGTSLCPPGLTAVEFLATRLSKVTQVYSDMRIRGLPFVIVEEMKYAIGPWFADPSDLPANMETWAHWRWPAPVPVRLQAAKVVRDRIVEGVIPPAVPGSIRDRLEKAVAAEAAAEGARPFNAVERIAALEQHAASYSREVAAINFRAAQIGRRVVVHDGTAGAGGHTMWRNRWGYLIALDAGWKATILTVDASITAGGDVLSIAAAIPPLEHPFRHGPAWSFGDPGTWRRRYEGYEQATPPEQQAQAEAAAPATNSTP